MADEKQACLVIVDIQGKLAQIMHDKKKLFQNAEILVRIFQQLNLPVLWCEQVPKALGPTIDSISVLLSDQQPIHKSCFSAWEEPGFQKQLIELNCQQVILCGIESHICIFQTARDLLKNGFRVEVVADAVSSRTPDNKAVGLNRITQVGGQITSVEMLLFDLLKTAQHPSFKVLSKLIK